MLVPVPVTVPVISQAALSAAFAMVRPSRLATSSLALLMNLQPVISAPPGWLVMIVASAKAIPLTAVAIVASVGRMGGKGVTVSS